MQVRLVLVLMVCMPCLLSCSRSKDPQYFVLNPVLSSVKPTKSYINMRLGINKITIPDYLDKKPFSLFYTANLSKIDENYEWSEEMQDNIERVIKTDLSRFLPGALVELNPWDIKFVPAYELQVDIIEFKADVQGNSILQAEYVIFDQKQPIAKYSAYYHQKVTTITPQNIVISMNNNLTQLTRDIAKKIPDRIVVER